MNLVKHWISKAFLCHSTAFVSSFETLMTQGCDCEDDPLTFTCTKAVIGTSLCCCFNVHKTSHPGFSVQLSTDLCWHAFLREFPAVLQVYLRQNRRMLTDARPRQKIEWGRKGMKERKRKGFVQQRLITRQVMFVSRCVKGILCLSALYVLVLGFLSLLSIYILYDRTFNDTQTLKLGSGVLLKACFDRVSSLCCRCAVKYALALLVAGF